MMSTMHQADNEFKLSIIETLGVIKYEKAVPILLEMLKERPLVASAFRLDLEEKIFATLGKIGWGRALPVLKEISQPKFFSLLRKYPEKVRLAAARAIASIEAKEAEKSRQAGR